MEKPPKSCYFAADHSGYSLLKILSAPRNSSDLKCFITAIPVTSYSHCIRTQTFYFYTFLEIELLLTSISSFCRRATNIFCLFTIDKKLERENTDYKCESCFSTELNPNLYSINCLKHVSKSKTLWSFVWLFLKKKKSFTVMYKAFPSTETEMTHAEQAKNCL